VFVVARGSSAARPTLRDTQALGWTLVRSARYRNGRLYAFAGNTAAAGTLDALTIDLGSGQTGTAYEIIVYRVRRAAYFGAAAVVQTAVQNDGNGANVPAPSFPAKVDGADAVVVALAATATWDIAAPAGWSDNYWNVEANPAGEAKAISVAGGFTGRLIPWADNAGIGSSFGTIALELRSPSSSSRTLRRATPSRHHVADDRAALLRKASRLPPGTASRPSGDRVPVSPSSGAAHKLLPASSVSAANG
jgi:hypothetical protein